MILCFKTLANIVNYLIRISIKYILTNDCFLNAQSFKYQTDTCYQSGYQLVIDVYD